MYENWCKFNQSIKKYLVGNLNPQVLIYLCLHYPKPLNLKTPGVVLEGERVAGPVFAGGCHPDRNLDPDSLRCRIRFFCIRIRLEQPYFSNMSTSRISFFLENRTRIRNQYFLCIYFNLQKCNDYNVIKVVFVFVKMKHG